MSFKTTVVRNFVAVCILSLCCAAQPASAAVVAFWQFEPGNLTVDSSGNGHTLTNTGVVSSVDVPGTSSAGSASFNNTNSFMRTTSNLNLSGATKLTVEFFYKQTGNFANDADIFFEHSGDFNSNIGGIVGSGDFIGGTNKLNAGYRVSGYLLDVVNPVSVSGWHHVAMLFDTTAASPSANSDVVKIYRDSVLVGTDSILNSTRAAFINNTFFLGARNGSNFFYGGLMDQFRISDTLLAPSEFLQANFPPAPEPGSLTLLLLGSLALARATRRRQ